MSWKLALTAAAILFGYSNHLLTDEAPSQTSTPAHSEDLKDLGWLVGTWEDAENEKDVDVSSSWKWGMNKNYLIQSFDAKVPDQPPLEGRQVVMWDPAEKRLRSWIFDSDGGFGQGFWSKQDNSWIASMLFTLPDGRKGSANHIYTKIDDKSYTFASVNRDIEGNLLPNIGPFKVVKKPEGGL